MNLEVSVILLTALSLCSAHIGGGSLMIQEVNPQVYCGRNLARALAQICSFRYGPDKRSEGTMYGALLAPPPYYKDQEFGWPWISPHKARGLTSSRGKRIVDGVVDECCTKACSIDEMLNYCN